MRYGTLTLVLAEVTPPTMWFTGWFGPRGLATIVFALTVIEASGLEGADRIVDVATITVLASVFAHGASAAALSGRYAGWVDANRGRLTYETETVELGSHVRPERRTPFTPGRRTSR